MFHVKQYSLLVFFFLYLFLFLYYILYILYLYSIFFYIAFLLLVWCNYIDILLFVVCSPFLALVWDTNKQ